MYKNVLQHIDNIGMWPVISFAIFFIFFLCLLWWVFTADRGFIQKMKNLPMEDGAEKNHRPTKSHSL